MRWWLKQITLLVCLISLPACSLAVGGNSTSLPPTPTKVAVRPISFYSTPDWRGAERRSLYSINADGSNLIHISAPPIFDYPAWSPDGQQVAFIGDDLYVMSTKGGEPTRLTHLETKRPVLSPAWSPDSKEIAFIAYMDEYIDGSPTVNLYLYLIDVSEALRGGPDSGIKRIIIFGGSAWNPHWSPNGQQIALTYREESDPPEQIAVINASIIRGASDGYWIELGDGEGSTWSPDSQKIAFAAYRDNQGGIFVRDMKGGNLMYLAKSEIKGHSPIWSPDGLKIAFISDLGGYDEIYTMDTDGSNAINLTHNPADDFAPAWSPDSKQIAFVSERDANQEIYVMNADGSDQRRLTNTPDYEWYPVWVP